MDDTIKKASMIQVQDLPKIYSFIKDVGMPIVLLIGMAYLFFFQSNQNNDERKAMQLQVTETQTEMISFLKEQNKELIEGINATNIQLKDLNEVMQDIKRKIK